MTILGLGLFPALALSQRIEPVLEGGMDLPPFGLISTPTVNSAIAGVPFQAINDSGNWAVTQGVILDGVPGNFGAALVSNGSPLVGTGSSIPGGGTLLQFNGVAINSQDEVAYGAQLDASQPEFAIIARNSQVVRTGDPTGIPGFEWQSFRLLGFSSSGRAILSGEVVATATQETSVAFGFVDLDSAGAVISRGLFALEGQPLPGGNDAMFLGELRRWTIADNGSVLWIARGSVPGGGFRFFLIQDETVLAIGGTPSPNDGAPWRLANSDIALSPDGSRWAVSGTVSEGANNLDSTAVIVDGALRFAEGMILDSLGPAPIARASNAVVSNSGEVTWIAKGEDPSVQLRIMADEEVVVRPGLDLVAGQRSLLSDQTLSPNGRFGLLGLRAEDLTSVAKLDVLGAPLVCGDISDTFEPNDSCIAATPIGPESTFDGFLPTATVMQADDDWYEIAIPADQVLTVQARHAAIEAEVDIELLFGCPAPLPILQTFQGAENEGLHFENTSGVPTSIFVRVFLAEESPSDCAEYRLSVEFREPVPCLEDGGPAPDALEPNSAFRSPAQLSEGSFSNLNVSQIDPDYYSVVVPPQSSVTYTATPGSAQILTISIQAEDGSGLEEIIDTGVPASITVENPSMVSREAVLRVALNNVSAAICRNYTLTVDHSVDLVGTQLCAGSVNSTDQPATLTTIGSLDSSLNQLVLGVDGLPQGTPGFFIVSPQTSPGVTPSGSQGILCLTGSIGRILDSLATASNTGQVSWQQNLTMIPQPTGTVSVMAGSTWHFQHWYRDVNPIPTSNFSSAVSILFQ